MLGLYSTFRQREKLYDDKFKTLNLQARLDKQYKLAMLKANARVSGTVLPREMLIPKEQIKPSDVEIKLKNQLLPHMLNLNEVNNFLAHIIARDKLDELDNMFQQFKTEYLVGTTRANSTFMRQLYDAFVSNKLRAPIVPPEPAVAGAGMLRGGCVSCGVRGGMSRYMTPHERCGLVNAVKQAGHDNI